MQGVLTLGQRIRARREELGLTLAQVGESAGVSRAFVHQVEVGKSQPSLEVLRDMAARLSIGLDSLIEGRRHDASQQLELELARLALAKGSPESALDRAKALQDIKSWPLSADAGLCAAEALIGLGRESEANQVLDQVNVVAQAHGDQVRIDQAAALRQRRPHQLEASDHEREMDRAIRAGNVESALEHARSARILAAARPMPGRRRDDRHALPPERKKSR
jgi:transcriptional regulator with XRE-family HTH domain